MSIYQLIDFKDVVGFYSNIQSLEKAAIAYVKDKYKPSEIKVSDIDKTPVKSLADLDPKFQFRVSDVLFTVYQIKVDGYYDICFKRTEIS